MTDQPSKTTKPTKAVSKPYRMIKASDLSLEAGFDDKVNDVNFSQCIRALRCSWRQGTVSVKGRSDVARSTKKPWKQKGTGRARAGSARSPLWRGGGVTFGPSERVKSLKVPRALRRKVISSLIGNFVSNNKITALNMSTPKDKPKTAIAYKALSAAGVAGNRVLMFLRGDDIIARASFANIPNVYVIGFDELNAFALGSAQRWLFLEQDLATFKDMVAKWI